MSPGPEKARPRWLRRVLARPAGALRRGASVARSAGRPAGALRRAGPRVAPAVRSAAARLAPPRLRRATRRPAAGVLRALRWALRRALRLAALVERLLATGWRRLAGPAGAATARLAGLVTPTRGAAAVALAAFAVVAVAQFTDYRAVAIGQPQYEGVAPLASAPMVEPGTPWSAHGPAVLALALISVAAVLAAVTGRSPGSPADRGQRRLAAGGAASAAVAIGVVLAIDLPRARRLGEPGDLYANAEAVLLDGFYMQLAGACCLLCLAVLPILWRRSQ